MTDTTEVEAKPKPIQLTKKSVLEALEAAVEERGVDYNYLKHFTTCEYVIGDEDADPAERGKPGCLVGVVLHHLGVPLEAMMNNTTADFMLERLSADGVVSYRTELVVEGLRKAQELQDAGESWGDAVKAGKKIITT